MDACLCDSYLIGYLINGDMVIVLYIRVITKEISKDEFFSWSKDTAKRIAVALRLKPFS